MIKEVLLNKINKSEFLKNTATLVTGTTLAQLIPIFIQPFLRRYYSAEIFGAYAVYMSLIGILYVITSLRYEQAIVIPGKDEEAINIFSLAQFLNLCISLVLAVVIFLFGKSILQFINLPGEHLIFLLLVPAATFLFNLQQSINLWLIRKKKFLDVSKVKFVRRGTEGFFQMIFRYLKFPNGILLGDIIGHVINCAYGLLKVKRNQNVFKQINVQSIKKVALKYSDYPKFNTVSSFLSTSSLLLPTIFINKFFGPENAAYFDLSRLLLLTPIALVAGSISNVMLQRISERRFQNRVFRKEILSIVLLGLAFGSAEIIFILPFGEKIFVLIFGAAWELSGTISKLLIWVFVLNFFTVSLSSTFLALQKIRELSIYQVVNFILVLSLIFFKGVDFLLFIRIFVTINIISALLFLALWAKVVYYYNKNATA